LPYTKKIGYPGGRSDKAEGGIEVIPPLKNIIAPQKIALMSGEF